MGDHDPTNQPLAYELAYKLSSYPLAGWLNPVEGVYRIDSEVFTAHLGDETLKSKKGQGVLSGWGVGQWVGRVDC